MRERCKRCAHCTHELPLDCFAVTNKTADGRHIYCDACRVQNPHLNWGVCPACHTRRSLTKFPALDSREPCSYCSAEYGGSAPAMLNAAALEHGGHTTVRDLLQALGHPNPNKGELNAGARWLRARGYRENKRNGVRGFAVSVRLDGSEFRQFVETYGPAADALELPPAYREKLMSGAAPPAYLRLAMSAIVAGLPPYRAPKGGTP